MNKRSGIASKASELKANDSDIIDKDIELDLPDTTVDIVDIVIKLFNLFLVSNKKCLFVELRANK